jgi:hypothetical protein
MGKEPEVRIWERTDLDIEEDLEWDETERERLIKEGKEGQIREIIPQESLLGDASKEALKLGINIPGFKAALKDQVLAMRVSDRLTGSKRIVEIHWACHELLQNWLRSEFPQVHFSRWPWGNWWVIRLTEYNPAKRSTEKTEISLVIA